MLDQEWHTSCQRGWGGGRLKGFVAFTRYSRNIDSYDSFVYIKGYKRWFHKNEIVSVWLILTDNWLIIEGPIAWIDGLRRLRRLRRRLKGRAEGLDGQAHREIAPVASGWSTARWLWWKGHSRRAHGTGTMALSSDSTWLCRLCRLCRLFNQYVEAELKTWVIWNRGRSLNAYPFLAWTLASGGELGHLEERQDDFHASLSGCLLLLGQICATSCLANSIQTTMPAMHSTMLCLCRSHAVSRRCL